MRDVKDIALENWGLKVISLLLAVTLWLAVHGDPGTEKTITVPVRDMCPSCARTHLDLSKPAFGALADHDLGNVSGVTWEFVG